MLNIWTQGNYFYLEDTVENIIFEAHSKNVKITKNQLSSNEYYIRNVGGWEKQNIPIPFSSLKKQGGAPWADQTEFETFYQNETGKSNGGGNGGGVASVTGYNVDNTDPLNPVINDVHSTQINDNTTDISETRNEVSNNTNNIGQNSFDISQNTNSINENENSINQLQLNVDSKVQSVSGYNVDDSNLQNPVIIDQYEERFDNLTLLVNNSWHTITVPGLPANKLLNVCISVDQDNQDAGCRQVGSSLNRVVNIGENGFGVSSISTIVKTNASGEIEVFSNRRQDATFTVLAYQN